MPLSTWRTQITNVWSKATVVLVKFQSLQVPESCTFTSYAPSRKGPCFYFTEIHLQKPQISGELLLDVTRKLIANYSLKTSNFDSRQIRYPILHILLYLLNSIDHLLPLVDPMPLLHYLWHWVVHSTIFLLPPHPPKSRECKLGRHEFHCLKKPLLIGCMPKAVNWNCHIESWGKYHPLAACFLFWNVSHDTRVHHPLEWDDQHPDGVQQEPHVDYMYCQFCLISPYLFLQWQEDIESSEALLYPEERNRAKQFIFYRRMTRELYGHLGKGIRKPLPPCFVQWARDLYPNGEAEEGVYTGFKHGPGGDGGGSFNI
jgi:hypothetical protein